MTGNAFMEEVRLLSQVWTARKVEGRDSRWCTNKMSKGRVQSQNKYFMLDATGLIPRQGLLKQKRKAKQKPNKTALQVTVAKKNFQKSTLNGDQQFRKVLGDYSL